MQTGELARLALAALAGATITALCFISAPADLERSKASAPGECDCTCCNDRELVSDSYQCQSSPAPCTSRYRALPRAASLLQASTAPAVVSAVAPSEGLHIAFGAIRHEESAWLQPIHGADVQRPSKDRDMEVDDDEEQWFHWLHQQANDEVPVFEHDALQKEYAAHDSDFLGAAIWLFLVTVIPIAFSVMHGRETTWIHYMQSLALLFWLIFGLVAFSGLIKFKSSHWKEVRTLNLVETVYLTAQVITTVGYGDVVPATRCGQGVMAVFVLFGLIVMANIISQIGTMLISRVEDLAQRLRTQTLVSAYRRAAIMSPMDAHADSRQTLEWREWLRKSVHLSNMQSKFFQSFMIYLSLCVIGVVFFHYSEKKSWLEAVYMVIITSASLGFGACTPTTRHGFAFSAFWMVFSCGALCSVIGNFSHMMLLMERQEQINLPKRRKAFYASCAHVRQQEGDRVNRYEFTRLMLLYADIVQESDLQCLESTFDHLDPDPQNLVKIEDIYDACFGDSCASGS